MNKYQFLRTLKMDIKRGLHYLPHMLFTTIIFVIAGIILIQNSEELMYGRANFDQIAVCYYMPNDSVYNQMAATIVSNTESVKDSMNLFQVDSIEEGYRLLEANEVYAFVIIPNDFINSVMYGTNSPIELNYKGNGSFEEFAVNDLMVNFGGYLGTAQAQTYTIYDVCTRNGVPKDVAYNYGDTVDMKNITFVINRESLFQTEKLGGNTVNENNATIVSSVLLIIAIMSGFILTRYYLRPCNAYYMKQSMYGLSRVKVYMSQILSSTLLLFIILSPAVILLYFIVPSIKLTSIIFLPVITFLLSLYMSTVSWIFKNESQASLFIVLIFILLLYLAGGIMPLKFLPKVIQQLSVINPVHWLIKLCVLIMF